MVRRSVLTIGLLCGASAAAALAFASELSRVGSRVEGAVSREHGAAGVPSSGTSAHGDGRPVGAPDAIPRREYCRFPPGGGSEAATTVPADTLLGNAIDSEPLALQGQSRVSQALPPALCSGDTVRLPLTSRLGTR
jgi:hypothetical protein